MNQAERIAWAIVSTAGIVSGSAVAAAQPPQGEGDRPPREASLELSPRASYAFETNLDGAGEYAVGRFGVGLSYTKPVLERSVLSLGLDLTRHEYDFSGATGLAPGGDPLGGATTFGVSARYIHPIDDTFTFLGGASLQWSAEDGADFGEALVPAGFAAVGWKLSDDFTLTLGAQIIDQLEDDIRVLPLIGVEWIIDENLRLTSTEVGRVLADVGGGGLGLVYDSSEDLSFVAGAIFASDEFRLDEDGPLPDGVLREDRVIAGLGVLWEPSENVSAALGVGATVWSNIETLDAGGTEIGSEDGDPTPFITARVRVMF